MKAVMVEATVLFLKHHETSWYEVALLQGRSFEGYRVEPMKSNRGAV